MDLEARKISFVQEFLRLQNEEIISALENFMHSRKAELSDAEMKPMSTQQLNAEIDRAVDDAANGRITPAKNLKDKIRRWG
ncbi:MAG: hypothetical protein ACO1N9_11315 [Flavobacterium sp.]